MKSDRKAGGLLGLKGARFRPMAMAGRNDVEATVASADGLSEREIADAGHATATIAKTGAILKLARNIVVQRGEVSDADLEQARASGLTDGEIVETVANVALNIFTNYLNHVARTVVDFPETELRTAQGTRVDKR